MRRLLKAAVGNLFVGSSMKNHGNKKERIGQRGQQLVSRYVDSASRIHISDSKQPLRWTAAVKSQAVPLLESKLEKTAPFGTGFDTRTEGRCRRR